MISCRNLRVVFGSVVAVSDIDLDVDQGHVCVLLGPNGAGKSTTIKALAGILAPIGGRITIAGHDLESNPQKVKQRIGVLPDDLGLFDSLTVAEHLILTGEVYEIESETARQRTNDLLRFLDLESSIDKFIVTCSHGTRKKTSLAMALMPNPPVLLLDEPFEGIDPVTTAALCELIVAASKRGLAILLTTHVLAVAQRVATDFIVMREGHIVSRTPSTEVRVPLGQHYLEHLDLDSKAGLDWLGR